MKGVRSIVVLGIDPGKTTGFCVFAQTLFLKRSKGSGEGGVAGSEWVVSHQECRGWEGETGTIVQCEDAVGKAWNLFWNAVERRESAQVSVGGVGRAARGASGSGGVLYGLAIEDFRLRPKREAGGGMGIDVKSTGWDALSPVWVRSWIEMAWYLWCGGVGDGGKASEAFWKYQMASDAKGVFTNERLRALGMYSVGSDHVRDATRHALLCARREGFRV